MDEKADVVYLDPYTSGKDKNQNEIHRCFQQESKDGPNKSLIYGRQLLMKKDKNEVVVIRDSTILIVDKMKSKACNPYPKYKGARYVGIIDAILTKNSRIMFFLKANGRLDSIDLKRTTHGNMIHLENSKSHSESQNSEENKDSNESSKR